MPENMPEIATQQLQRQDVEDRTIYNATKSEIFWKNFLAGLGRGLGMLLVQIVGYAIIVWLFAGFIWPVIRPLVDSLGTITQSLESNLHTLDSLQNSFGSGSSNGSRDNTY